MVDAFTGILGEVLGLMVSLVVTSAVFGLSIWVYVPIKGEPFPERRSGGGEEVHGLFHRHMGLGQRNPLPDGPGDGGGASGHCCFLFRHVAVF